ncbi:MAG: trigger factor [Bryobacteraceae bacterium]
MAVIEGCKHALDITVPLDEVAGETERVVADIQKRAKIPGFRPGKAPLSLIRKQFQGDIRNRVLENLIPRHLQTRLEEENLRPVATPDVTNVKFDAGVPLEFTAEFEVAPQVDLLEYKGLTVPYHDPEITEEDITGRLGDLRERKAEYVNVDPRPLEDGDHAALALESLAGLAGPPVKQDELTLELGGGETLEAFTTNLRGMSPGESKQFEVAYPDDYGQRRLAGKTVLFRAEVKAVRRKELPEVNDEFAKDLGDYQSLDELREEIRKSLFSERQHAAQEEAKNKLVESLVDAHDFPLPEAYVERQVRNRIEQVLGGLAAEGVDIAKLKPDWQKLRETHRERAVREVRASLLLSKVAAAESIEATRDEVDREVERYARQHREPIAAARIRMEKDGALGRLAAHIQTQKTLGFLFEHARKVAE